MKPSSPRLHLQPFKCLPANPDPLLIRLCVFVHIAYVLLCLRDHFFIEDDSPYFDWKHRYDMTSHIVQKMIIKQCFLFHMEASGSGGIFMTYVIIALLFHPISLIPYVKGMLICTHMQNEKWY